MLPVTMLRIGKLSQQAIAAATVLAERYGGDAVRLSASEIADARELPRPVVAKVLATLAQSGIVSGAPGPSGGYRLARPPETVALYDIVAAFERTDVRPMCPFGPNWCGTGDLCPAVLQVKPDEAAAHRRPALEAGAPAQGRHEDQPARLQLRADGGTDLQLALGQRGRLRPPAGMEVGAHLPLGG